MKKMMFAVLVVILMITNAMWAVADDVSVDPNVNPLVVARALALKTPDHYRCYLQCQMLIENSFQSMEMQFIMANIDNVFVITALVVDGEQIDLPEPIYGIPMGDGGLMRDVYLNVSAMTKNEEYAGHGYLQKESVSKNDCLTVVITPADLKQLIPIDVSMYENDIQLIIEDFGYGYGWGLENGDFYVYLPPIGGQYHYILRRWSDGTVISSGWLEPFKPAVIANDSYVGITYLGNVQGVEFSRSAGLDDWEGVNNISFNCLIPTDDGNVMGKVIFTDVGSGSLEIIVSGEYWIYIQSATSSDGDMPLLQLEDHSSSRNGWSETRVNTVGANVGNVVISIIPKPENIRLNPWVNLHRFYGKLDYLNPKW